MYLIRFITALVRGTLIALNMLIFGTLFLVLCLLIGYKKTSKLGITWFWGHIFVFLAGGRMLVKGKENIPKDKGAVFIFSHSSYLDIPVLCATKGGQINFAAKSGLLKFPILGFIMREVEAIVIYRDNIRKTIEQYQLAGKRLKEGFSFMIAPEGPRTTGEELKPFKSGPFIFAMNAKADLVPVLIYGAHRLWPKEDKMANLNKFCGKIYVEYFPKVSTADWTDENRKEKAEEIRQMMLLRLKDWQLEKK